MKSIGFASIVLLFILSCSISRSKKELRTAEKRAPVKCMENSPERRGKEGCTILTNRALFGDVTGNLFWHIDKFDSLETAEKAAGPNSLAAEAHNSYWLMTVEEKNENHHHGHHIAWIGPLELHVAEHYSMRILSSLLYPGSLTPVHTHSGPEVFFIIEGEQCIEMSGESQYLSQGQFFVVPINTVHRGRVIGPKPRKALALILYNSAYPASSDLNNPPAMISCK